MTRRLYRSRTDKVLGGVCGGLGYYLDVDPIILRVLWIVGALAYGVGVLAYIVAWIVIPQAPEFEVRETAGRGSGVGTGTWGPASAAGAETPGGRSAAPEEGGDRGAVPETGTAGEAKPAPEEATWDRPGGGEQPETDREAVERRRRNTAIILIAVGVIFFIRQLLPFGPSLWPLLLIAAGVLILYRGMDSGRKGRPR